MGETLIFEGGPDPNGPPAPPRPDDLQTLIEALIECVPPPAREPLLHTCGGDLIESARTAARLASRRIVELHERVIQLEQLALTDELTGLLNRRGFARELDRSLARARRYGDEGALIYIDLDNFKSINDTLGHAAGDAVLRHVGRLLTNAVRCTDSVGRLGGDEFAVLLSRASIAGSRKRAQEIERCLAPAIVPFDGKTIRVRASIGLQAYGRDCAQDVTDLLDGADRAMYACKKGRRTQGAWQPMLITA